MSSSTEASWGRSISMVSVGTVGSVTKEMESSASFFFSFSCYFSLGYGAYYPYGNWFYLLVFLECLIALINNGIIIFYAFHLLFERK